MRARYQEFDTVANAQIESDAAAVLAEGEVRRVGDRRRQPEERGPTEERYSSGQGSPRATGGSAMFGFGH